MGCCGGRKLRGLQEVPIFQYPGLKSRPRNSFECVAPSGIRFLDFDRIRGMCRCCVAAGDYSHLLKSADSTCARSRLPQIVGAGLGHLGGDGVAATNSSSSSSSSPSASDL
mmetsp:Transcript_25640/g.40196  ORF Transcript_25640/g.40196 Transcript_25640/m.40196 type:complete len:111 (-) Transcript_25640:1182-1514(-)